MSKFFADVVQDAALEKIAEGNLLSLCSGEPADLAGLSAVTLASVALTPGDGNGDFVIDDGLTSGRRAVVSLHNGVSVIADGIGTHLVISDDDELKAGTTCDAQPVTVGGVANIPAHSYVIPEPV